ncbi:acid protease [Dentipellis sp. KUC8613]|nr:acid protease [Dentipellis sp. KUC8613]
MFLSPHSLLLAALLQSASHVAALTLDIRGERRMPGATDFSRRADHSEDLQNTNNNVDYYTNITLGGQSFSVLIDTGSSDLWVAGSVPNAQDTGKSATVNYAIGQASVQVTPSSSDPQGKGLIGLGPNSGSHIRETLNSAAGDSVIDSIFRQDKSAPNYLTILLSRASDPTDKFPGQITVGEIVPGYENINNQAKVSVTRLSSRNAGDQHWQVLLDENGIIGPDGQPISVQSQVSSTSNKKQLTAIFDSGFTLPQVPKAVSDGIYARIEGAEFQNLSLTGPIWTIPCDQEVNVTFKIGGASYPIHPLDTSMDMGQKDSSGKKVCIGSFQTITSAEDPDFDIILGMAFLRNAYMMVNYGDFVDGSTSKTDPYVQLLSITNDTAEAHSDFVNVRLDGVDKTGEQRLSNTPAPSSDPTPDNTKNDDDSPIKSFWDKHKMVIIIVASSVGGVLLLAILACCCCGRRNKGARPAFVPAGFGGARSYQPLHEPAPAGEMHQVQGYHPTPGSSYPNPWERR